MAVLRPFLAIFFANYINIFHKTGVQTFETNYRTRAIITRSRFETTLVYKPRILGLKNEEFSFLVHKLSVI